MTLNTGYHLQVYTFVTLTLCGLVQYFTGMQSVLWMPFFLTLLMVGLLVTQMRDGSLHFNAQGTIALALYSLFLVPIGASALTQGGITVVIVAFKNEVTLSLMMICLLLGFCRESQIHHTTHYLYWVFYAQIPVVTYQVLLVVPQRVTVYGEDEKWDSTVGTFGGDPIGGGSIAIMDLFCLLVTLLKVFEYRHGLTMSRSMTLHIVLGIGLCIIGEAKFIILLSPIFLAWVRLSSSYVKDASKVNLKALLVIAAGMLLLTSLLIVTLACYYPMTLGSDLPKSLLSIFTGSLSYTFDPSYIMSTDELGHFTTFLFWLKNNGLWGLSRALFGYGLNATNSGSTVSPGFLDIIYNLILDSISLSILLWEVGVIGALLFINLFIYILRVCQPKPLLTLEQLDQRDLQLLSFTPVFNAFAVSCLVNLPYSQILVITLMSQFLFYLPLGSSLVIRWTVLRCVR